MQIFKPDFNNHTPAPVSKGEQMPAGTHVMKIINIEAAPGIGFDVYFVINPEYRPTRKRFYTTSEKAINFTNRFVCDAFIFHKIPTTADITALIGKTFKVKLIETDAGYVDIEGFINPCKPTSVAPAQQPTVALAPPVYVPPVHTPTVVHSVIPPAPSVILAAGITEEDLPF